MDKYLLYDPEDGYRTFETIESLKLHVNNLDFSEKFPEDSFRIYELTEVSVFKETDNAENYKCIKEDRYICWEKGSCYREDEECEDAEEWPYSNDKDRVGILEWIKK